MDYFSRLVGGTSTSPTRQAGYDSAQQRSIRFKRAHDQLQQIWRKNNASNLLASAVSVLSCLESIKRTLEDEVQTPAPHLCARHVSTFRAYTTLVQVTSNYSDELIVHETLDIFRILIDCEEVNFLEETGFADALIGFVGKLSTGGSSNDSEIKIAEVLFGIAAKIRLQPEILPIWFRPRTQGSGSAAEQGKAGRIFNADKDNFPLFYLTLDYVHHDGKVGDFARTGLLYIIEIASTSEALEKWIVESDLATLMASGLGALYSQLSRKLVIAFPTDSVPAIVSLSEAASQRIPSDAESTTSPQLQSHLATFLSHLIFWQDVLEHCRSDDIKRSLLDHFKFLFLQQLLYPSLMESSDLDGGSSVAVLTYLRCIVESINHAELLKVTMTYLLALPEISEDQSKPARPTTLARRRMSSMLITTLAQGLEKPMPDLFTLVDLVLSSLNSRNQQTVAATLRLVSVILQTQHQYAVVSIVKIQALGTEIPVRSIAAHKRDTETLFSMAEDIAEHEDLGDMYEAHLEDGRTLIESHCCSASLLTLPGSGVQDGLAGASKNVHTKNVQNHLIISDDPLTDSLVSQLQDFLANDVTTNLGLTQAFATLASCGHTRLEPWLLDGRSEEPKCGSDSESGDSDNDDTIIVRTKGENEGQIGDPVRCNSPKLTDVRFSNPRGPSPVLAALETLVHQVEKFRHDIKDFDTYLAERRHVFRTSEDIDKSVAKDVPMYRIAHGRKSEESTRASISRNRGADRMVSISERLMSDTSSNVSRSSSPRGRQPSDSLPSTPIGRSNHLRISPSPSPSQPGSRTFSPSPLREDSQTSTATKRESTSSIPADPLQQKLGIKKNYARRSRDTDNGETSSVRSGSTTAEVKSTETETRHISLGHLLTNIIILQEFILELAAIIEVRAGLFSEVRFI